MTKTHRPPVEHSAQLRENVSTFWKYGESANLWERTEFLRMMRAGSQFVAVRTSSGVLFCPSRFAGYRQNRLDQHLDDEWKDGRVTTPAITRVLRRDPLPDADLVKQYDDFLARHGTSPHRKTKPREFWVL